MLRPQVDQNWLISKPPWWSQRMRWSLVYNSFAWCILVFGVIYIGEFALILLQMKLAALRNEVEAFAVKFRLPGQQVGNLILTPYSYDFISRFCRCALLARSLFYHSVTNVPSVTCFRLNPTICTCRTSKNILKCCVDCWNCCLCSFYRVYCPQMLLSKVTNIENLI